MSTSSSPSAPWVPTTKVHTNYHLLPKCPPVLERARSQPRIKTELDDIPTELHCWKSSVTHVYPEVQGSLWNVQRLATLPSFLERTHCIIRDLSPAAISTNISGRLRDLSILAQFDDEKALAKAETSDHVRFHIRLYSYEDTAIVVEIQRRSGDVITFSHVARSLLRAAQGFEVDDNTQSPILAYSSHDHDWLTPATTDTTAVIATTIRKMASSLILSGPNHSFHQSLLCCSPLVHNTEEDVRIALDWAASLLGKDHLDANILGMESLRCLTNTKCTDSTDALAVARYVLIPHDRKKPCDPTNQARRKDCIDPTSSNSNRSFHEEGKFSIIHDAVFNMILHSKLSWPVLSVATPNTNTTMEWDEMDDLEQDFWTTMHHYALSTYANSVTLLRNSRKLHQVIDTDPRFEKDVLPVLFQELQKPINDTSRLHHSCEAARILK